MRSLGEAAQKRFGKNLREIRENLDMSQAELASRSGLTPAAVSQIEAGIREPALSSVVKILNVIPVTFERLMK